MFRIILLGLVGTLGYLVYKQRESVSPALPFNPAAPASTRVGAQPSQKYPFRAPQPMRVDNANQPWYNGPRQNMQGPADKISAVDILQQGATVVHSLKDVWGTMSSWFGTDESPDPYNLDSSDSIDQFSAYDMAGGAGDADNIVGDQTAEEFDSPDSSANWEVA